MALHTDLLAQARHLASKEPKKPKQASLRRAASAAYYALFHFLIDKSARLIVSGAGPDRRTLRQTASRAFNHSQMLKVSKAFGGTGDNKWKSLFAGETPADLATVASTFADLQLARHEADYDLSRDGPDILGSRSARRLRVGASHRAPGAPAARPHPGPARVSSAGRRPATASAVGSLSAVMWARGACIRARDSARPPNIGTRRTPTAEDRAPRLPRRNAIVDRRPQNQRLRPSPRRPRRRWPAGPRHRPAGRGRRRGASRSRGSAL